MDSVDTAGAVQLADRIIRVWCGYNCHWSPDLGDVALPEGWVFVPAGNHALTRTLSRGKHWIAYRHDGRHSKRIGVYAHRDDVANAKGEFEIKVAARSQPKRAQSPDVAIARSLGVPVARLRRAITRSGDSVVERLRRLQVAAEARVDEVRRQEVLANHRRSVAEFAVHIAEYLSFANHDEGVSLAKEVAAHAVAKGSVYHAEDLDWEERAERAARAYIRHNFTHYDADLDDRRSQYRGRWTQEDQVDWHDFEYADARQQAAMAVDAFLAARRTRIAVHPETESA